MNKIYRVIWNNATHCWQAVSELTKGHCKSSSSKTSVKEQIKELLPATISFSLTAFALQTFILFGAMPINDAYAAQTQGTCVQSTKFSLGPVNITGITATSFNNAMNNPTFVAIGGCISSDLSPTVNGRNSIAIGPESKVRGVDGYAMGTGAVVEIDGQDNNAKADAIALGNKTYAKGQGAVALGGAYSGTGSGARAEGTNAIAIGHQAVSSHNNSIALGSSSKTGIGETTSNLSYTNSQNTTQTISFAGNTIHGVISVGNSANNIYRQIQNVAAGRISSSSTDAINGSQLHAVQTMAQEGINTSRSALSTANAAQATAQTAQNIANSAASAASNAQITANAASTAASNAQTKAEAASTAAQAAQTTANNASTAAAAASTAASNAQTTANNAQAKAEAASTSAQAAQTTANNASTAAAAASTAASNAQTTANNAQAKAEAASTSAQAAQTTANNASTAAAAASTAASNAQTTANNAQAKAEAASTSAQAAQTTANNASTAAVAASTAASDAQITANAA
ncbi:ESPR-type extended signal peptide-containing protein [Mannheimia bovis]|uniref:ESPR domain-containing protein n=1 Tax=Mannheimia bovis TaxID=2770636 RepID=A0A7H1C4V4_9PAST|nr:ESPR-type extended signal peptide-containing protein [Mannheimia bovis]QNS16009.1 hypothetical protein ICJ55_04595 [Mannheimia bovis]